MNNLLNNLKEKTPPITGNPAVDGLLLKFIFGAAGVAAYWLMSKLNLHDQDFALVLTGFIASLIAGAVTIAYGWLLSKITQAKQLQAGIVLTTSGHAIDVNGNPIVVTAAAPPKQVTLKSAPEIMATVGPLAAPKAA